MRATKVGGSGVPGVYVCKSVQELETVVIVWEVVVAKAF